MFEVVALLTPSARRREVRPPGWRGIVTSALLVAAIPAGFWLLAHPVVGVALVGIGGAVVVAVARGGLTVTSRRDASDESGPRAPVRAGALRSRQ
jgi:hypothetical protein